MSLLRPRLVRRLVAAAVSTLLLAVVPAQAQAAEVRRIEGHGVQWWHDRAVHNRREINRIRRVMLHRSNVVEAINLACATYGNCSTLWRKAGCETGGTYSPRAYNRSSGASGLFQFLGSTWASTPFGRFSVWSPYANALAAGWMHRVGRGGEWSCR